MSSRPASLWWKVAFGAVVAVLACLAWLNVRGWRALVVARLLTTYNPPRVVARPAHSEPEVPPGFRVSVFAGGFTQPRWLAVAPDGDVFVADSAAGQIVVLRTDAGGKVAAREVFADHLDLPFGIAFHDNYVYVADTNQVLRFRYDPKTSKRMGDGERLLDLPGQGYHQHWTRSLAFSRDGKTLFISVGSKSNVSIESDHRRAAILAADLDGKNMRIYATGLRNAVGLACNPDSGDLWVAVNERDDLGDDEPSDYFTHVVAGGFYGWPYSYLGKHVDDRVPARPDLVAKAIVPDVLLGAHVAPLQFAFYDKRQFPSVYWHGAFIAEHGSWNRKVRAGYQLVFQAFQNGLPQGKPKPFFSGFVPDPAGKDVYGRMVGVAVAADGSLLVSDDGTNVIWRISYGADSSSSSAP